MKADLYTAHARSAGSTGLAHRTAAGFVVLTSGDGDDLIALIDGSQNDPDLIEQVVTAAEADGPAAFAMLFTAGGDLYAIASGAASIEATSPSGKFTLQAVPGEVVVHPLGVGLNEEDATGRLQMGVVPAASRSDLDLQAGTVQADWLEVAIGEAVLETDDAAIEPEPSVAAEVPTAPDAEPVAIVAPLPGAEEIPFAEAPAAAAAAAIPEPPRPAPVPAAEPPAPAPIPEPPRPEPGVAEEPLTSAPIPEPPRPEPAPVAEATPAAPIPEPPTPESAAPEPVVQAAEPVPEAMKTTAEIGPAMVLGVACSQGHHNHPDAVYCSQCGTKMGVHHTTVLINGPRPPLGVLVVDDGTTYSLNQDLVIGREPTSHADVLGGSASPMILTDDTLSLSRQHARIVLDDWSVGVQDLNSSNGTFLSRAGQAESWTKVEPTGVLTLEPGDRLRVGGRIIQVELHHVR